MPRSDNLDPDEWKTSEGHIVCPHISVPLMHVQRGIATWFNDYLVTMAGRDSANTDLLSRISAQYGEFEGIHADAVYIKMTGPQRANASIAILRIADHDPRQENFGVETRTLLMDDVITWTLKGETRSMVGNQRRSRHVQNEKGTRFRCGIHPSRKGCQDQDRRRHQNAPRNAQ